MINDALKELFKYCDSQAKFCGGNKCLIEKKLNLTEDVTCPIEILRYCFDENYLNGNKQEEKEIDPKTNLNEYMIKKLNEWYDILTKDGVNSKAKVRTDIMKVLDLLEKKLDDENA